MTTSLLDTFSRPLSSLRLSLIDRCNLRCAYCMPEAEYRWIANEARLTADEFVRLATIFVSLGVERIRLTGGEPLLSPQLSEIVTRIHQVSPSTELTLTTNGILLEQQAVALRRAGLNRLTVSLDTLDAKAFERLTRRAALPQVLQGIEAARQAGFEQGLKIDTVLMRSVNLSEVGALLDFAASVGAELRFIEYMDVGGATHWTMDEVVSQREVLSLIRQLRGTVRPVPRAPNESAPATRYQLDDGQLFGVIASTTVPFCGNCDRARVTADGVFLTCLYAKAGIDLRRALRHHHDDQEVRSLIEHAWKRRDDRGAEHRLTLASARGPLYVREALRNDLHAEMHTRGG
jgi:GTP 3',8-cyclase